MKRLALVLTLAALVAAAPASGATFSNAGAITIPSGAPGTTLGDATPYPSEIIAGSQFGSITDVDVNLFDVGHEALDDLDVLLVSPSGDSTVLMSDACGLLDVEDLDLTFDDQATDPLPDTSGSPCLSGSYRPSQYDDTSDTWPPAEPGPHGTTLSRFNGENAMGTWQLYVTDDATVDVGDVELGWSLVITTGPSVLGIPGAGTSGVAEPYPLTQAYTVNQTGVISDVNVVLNGVSHGHPEDLDIVLQAPNGEKVMLMSDACGSFDLTNYFWRFDDEASATMPIGGTTNVCSAFNHRPTDGSPTEDLPADAPPGPYSTSLATLDLQDPNGTWKLWAVDDSSGEAGFLINNFVLEVVHRATPTRFVTPALTAAEGSDVLVTVERSGVAGPVAGVVRLATAAGSASAGSDFTAVDQVLTFAANEATKTVPVTVPADASGEQAETFTLTLSEPDGDAAVAAPSTLTVTIPADPPPPGGGGGTQTQTQTVTTPAPPARTVTVARPSPPAASPVVSLPAFARAATLPARRRCVRGRARVVVTPTEPAGVSFAVTEILVGGRRIARLTGDRADDPYPVRIAAKRAAVLVRVTTADGRSASVSRAYPACPKPKRKRKRA